VAFALNGCDGQSPPLSQQHRRNKRAKAAASIVQAVKDGGRHLWHGVPLRVRQAKQDLRLTVGMTPIVMVLVVRPMAATHVCHRDEWRSALWPHPAPMPTQATGRVPHAHTLTMAVVPVLAMMLSVVLRTMG